MFRILDTFQLAFDRLRNNLNLVWWALVGLTAASTLAISLPLYVDSVNTRLLASRLSDPPYAFRFRYLGSWKGNIKMDDVNSATAAIRTEFEQTIGLPVTKQVQYLRGGAWTSRIEPNKLLGPFSIGALEGADSQMRITTGKWPPPAPGSAGAEPTETPTLTPTATFTRTITPTRTPTITPSISRTPTNTRTPTRTPATVAPTATPRPPSATPRASTTPVGGASAGAGTPSSPIPVLIPEKLVFQMGVNVGDILSVTPPGGKAIRLKVAATWSPYNADDPSWIFPPKFFDEVLLVQADDLVQVLAASSIEKPVEESAWYAVFNGSELRTSDVSALLSRIIDSQRDAESALPGIRLDVSPTDGLTKFSQEVNQLTQQLIIMVLPVAGLVLYFVTMIAGLLVSRQDQEDVTLRSRGMSRGGVLAIHFMMWLTLATIAFILGLIAAPYVVRLVGQTTSFLRFDNTDAPLAITFTSQALGAGLLTAILAASTGLFLAWRTTKQTITSFKQQAARASVAWWQRMYLDVLMLIPAYYVLWTLSRSGGLVSRAEDPFSNPLSFMGPTLFALGNTLLFLRIWPMLLRLAERLLSLGRGIALVMALRELTRSIGRYRGGLLMMCFTLSLTGFTASMASTIDRSLVDSVDYKVGADAVLVTAADTSTEETGTDTSTGATTRSVTGFNTIPPQALEGLPGVAYVSRVGRYDAQIVLANQRIDGVVLGVDRGTIAAIARWRGDYADMPIADLFNVLAGRREGILLNKSAALKYNLKINQEITFQVNALGGWHQAKVPIVGFVNYFPSLDPTQKFFIIANIDPVWESVGTELPHDVWMALQPGADLKKVEEAVQEKGFPVVQWIDPVTSLHEAQTAPSRRGVLGFLSVGFIASIVLTLVGAIIQSAASFRVQAVQLGSLRAMGLGSFPVAIYLIVSQGLAVFGGILGGTIIGALSTILYLPLLDFSGGLPPYLVRVAWGDILSVYAIFAGTLFSVTLLTTFLLSRERLFTVVKLGEVA